ncbi:MAG: ABC transporter permease [archaeon]
MIGDYFRFAIANIRKRRMRSWLTMLGIFIGIAAVVALISLGQGLQNSIEEQFQVLGKDKIFIQPKGGFGPPGSSTAVGLTTDDLSVVESVRGIDEAAPILLKNAKIEFNDQVRYEYLVSLGEDEDRELVKESMGLEIILGRDIRKGEKYKVALGYNYYAKSEALYGKQIKLRDKIKINDKDFEVVGFFDKIGNPSDDQTVVVSEDVTREMYDVGDEVDIIYARVEKGADASKVGEDVKKALRDHRDLEKGNEDFTVQTPEDLMESFGTILAIVQGVLIGIAAISLLVGGIGIMNTMYTAVLERTNEIGIMKAIGGKNSDILKIFLIESGTLGLVGGVIGVIIGYGLGKIVEVFAGAAGIDLFKAAFPWYLIVGALAFSFLIGSLAGMLPAIRASKLKPVDALRYE